MKKKLAPNVERSVERSSWAAHPLVVFIGIWTSAFLLYSLGLSDELIFDPKDFVYLYLLITLPFIFGYFYTKAFLFGLSHKGEPRQRVTFFKLHELQPRDCDLLWRRTIVLLSVWALLTCMEVAVSGGLPIVWLVRGSAKSYQDFGIPSLHGLLLSALMACSMVSFFLYLETRERKYLVVPVFSLIWFVASITRAFFIGLVLQMTFLYLSANRLRISQIAKVVVGYLCLVVLFGIVGDFRSGGAELIRAVAQPSDRFPEWLPTGFLWTYIYMVSPLNNLFNTIQLNPFIEGFTVASTTSELFPTFIRNILFSAKTLTEGDLANGNLNVSSGFVNSYLDMGLTGVAVLSVFLGLFAGLFWSRRRYLFYFLGYSFVAQALFLSVFFNIMLDLPYLFQLFWFYYLLRPIKAAIDGVSGEMTVVDQR